MVRVHPLAAAFLLASSVIAPSLQATPVAAASTARVITSAGTTRFSSVPSGSDAVGVLSHELAPDIDAAHQDDQALAAAAALRRGAGPAGGEVSVAPGVDAPSGALARSAPHVVTSFTGLNLRQQRLANGANQFTVEPPDQGLCVGNGFVVETINTVIRVFDTSGNPLTGVTDLNSFYGYAAQFDRTNGVVGPFITDPSCWFDAGTQRWFHLVLTLEVFPDTGDFTGVNHLDLAVSVSANPLDGFRIYRTDVTDDGTNGTPNHGCPPGGPPGPGHHPPTHPNACIGDFPHLGADKHGVFMTTNEYCLFCAGIGFHAAQIYALDKVALARGEGAVRVSQIDTLGMQNGKPGFTVWPATSPANGDFASNAGGVEYFTSSNAAEEVTGVRDASGLNHSDQIIVWALTNTGSLKSSSPDIRLHNTPVTVETYTVPPPSNQKVGSAPLKDCINDSTTPTIFGTIGCWTVLGLDFEPKHNEVEGPLDSSDSRVLSTTYARGLLWGTLDTGVRVGGKTKAGVLFYVIRPRISHGDNVVASLEQQGHIALANNNVIYGAVAATQTGRAVIAFTLAGDEHYPSAGYASLDAQRGAGELHVVAEGLGPQDGFSEYNAFGPAGEDTPARPRWGDYGAAVASGPSTIWVASEWIAQTCTLAQYMSPPFGSCGGTRVTLGNWATRVSEIDLKP